MPKTGYPTPDNPIGEMDFICKSIFIPNDDAFVAVLAGQLAEATNAWYWKKVGTMTPEQAAEYMSNALALIDFDNFCGGAMSCDDIADCIDTDATTQTAIDNQITLYNDRTGNLNPDSLSPDATEDNTLVDTRFPPSQRSQPAETPSNCDLDIIWGGIYYMVQQLDSVGRDWLEQAVASGDKWQRAASIAKNIPIVGSLASTALEQLAEVAQDLLNLYNAYSTETALQEIACALFEQVCDECRYPTYDEIADYYSQNSTITGGNLAEISLKAMVDFLIGSSLAISQLAYHTIISMVLFTLWVGSEFVGLRGTKWIAIWLDNGEEFANDAWEVLCNPCNPPYTVIKYDFRIDEQGFVARNAPPVLGDYVPDCCWEGVDIVIGGGGLRDYMDIKIDFPIGSRPKVAMWIIKYTRINGDGSGDNRLTIATGNSNANVDQTAKGNVGEGYQLYKKSWTPSEFTQFQVLNRVTGLAVNNPYGNIEQVWLVVTPDSGVQGTEAFDYAAWSNTPSIGAEYTGEMP